jgi:hypothetical protein
MEALLLPTTELTEIHAAEQLVNEPRSLQVQIAV